MKTTAIGIGLLFLLAFAGPLFAQGPFADVPTDHWAYEAVNELQQAGIVIGYPDETFGGKRAMTRYEFATAIARAIPVLEEKFTALIPKPPAGGNWATKEEVGALDARVKTLEGKTPGAGVTMEQFNTLQKLVNEFRDELAALGVDVDALKRQVTALSTQVEGIQKQLDKMPKWTGTATLFAIATQVDEDNTTTAYDIDGRPLQPKGPKAGKLINSISAVGDVDLKFTAAPAPNVKVGADINFGNYLSYLEGNVDTPATGVRPASGAGDEFFPYYAWVEAGLGPGTLTVGRIPMQFTPLTLKLIDKDSYTVNEKTDSGNFPVDGGKVEWTLGRVGLTAVAGKVNQNRVLSIGSDADQAAGARAVIGTPYGGSLGLTYLQTAGQSYDALEVFGGDWAGKIGGVTVAAEYAKSKQTNPDITDDAWAADGKIGTTLGGVGLDLGYRQIGPNFMAPGAWQKIGNTFNPTNIRGPYANITYGIGSSLGLTVGGALYKGANDVAVGDPGTLRLKDDKVLKADGNIKWALGGANSVKLAAEYVRWDPDGAGNNSIESYYTLGFSRQLAPGAGLDIGYQIVDFNAPGAASDYKGSVAVAQMRVAF